MKPDLLLFLLGKPGLSASKCCYYR